MLRRTLLAALLIAPVVAAAAGGRVSTTIHGEYASNWDRVKLGQDGDRVYGTYVCCGGGTIQGRITGHTLHYRWTQPGGWGRGVWTVEGNRLSGTWGANDDETNGGRWDLVRTPATIAQ